MRRPILLLTTMLAVTVAPFPQTGAQASCAAPYLKDTRELDLRRGATATIEGRAFTEGGCQDSESCSVGCSSCTPEDAPAEPMRDIELRLRQGPQTWDLGVADAGSAEDNRLGWVSWTVDLPQGVHPGPAKLLADSAQAVRVRIRGR